MTAATASKSKIDPLHAYPAGAFVASTRRPIPLVKTTFDVGIDSGLGMVVTHRTFRNAEDASIEATITFPVPVHAVLFHLELLIDGRVIKARSQRKAAARKTYEEAIETGKTTVLHEEVLHGVHMLSVGHIPPGTEVEVTAGWATTLTNVNGVGTLRIPLTVGDIYGRSGLPDSDDLLSGGPVQFADIVVSTRDGQVSLLGGRLKDGRASVPLNAPIDLTVIGWTPRDLSGRTSDGRRVLLRIEPSSAGESALDVAILVDRSGSMEEPCSSSGRLTKHQALVAALRAITVHESDKVDLWQFSNLPELVGNTGERSQRQSMFSFARRSRRELEALVARLQPPSGGTETGRALHGVIAESVAKNLLLITDGKSHALDVQKLARAGRRISVVLVGEDSLEANVGHLAALTGGDIFVSTGADVAGSVEAALRALRSPHSPTSASGSVSVSRAGMAVTAKWEVDGGPIEASFESRAVAAFASSLALPSLNDDAAAELAVSEGLVTHLTSLVLVDDHGEKQEGLPGNRKIPLPMPSRAAYQDEFLARRMATPMAEDEQSSLRSIEAFSAPSNFRKVSAALSEKLPEVRSNWLADLARGIDWDLAPDRIQGGDLSKVGHNTAQSIREAALVSEFAAVARRLGLDPIVLVIALAAREAAANNRSAARIAKAIFLGKDLAALPTALRALGLWADLGLAQKGLPPVW